MKIIEAIVPCYNEEKCIELFYNKMCEVFEDFQGYDFIITYVDDGSKDATLNQIKKVWANAQKGKIQYISLSRNFGKESAIFAGLSESTGDYVALMDADLQHPPELLKKMLVAIEDEGYDCATARRISRKGEPPVRSSLARGFYHVINRVTVIDLVPGSTDYRLMKRSVAQALVSMKERERFTKGMYSWIGFKNKWIEYENVERVVGTTKWSLKGLFRYAYNGFIAYATTPLRGVVYLGMIIVFFATIFAIKIFTDALNSPNSRNGYASILIVMLFLGGFIIAILGIIGEYMARIYMEVKQRPIYFVRETCLYKGTTEEMVDEKSE